MEVAPPQVSEPAVAAPKLVDQDRFAALEKRVEALFRQIQQRDSLPAPTPVSSVNKTAKFNKVNGYFPSAPLTPEFSLPASPALQQEESVEAFEKPSTKLALQILDIIQRYGQNVSPQDVPWAGKTKFLPYVEEYVKKNEPVRMVLPAFPFKSPNRQEKTLSSMPDLGEELGLMHLNGLCESIVEIYPQGANVTITSDGLVYNGKSHHGPPKVGFVLLTGFRSDDDRGQRGLGLFHCRPRYHCEEGASSSQGDAHRGSARD